MRILFGLLFIIIGTLNLLFPRAMWYFSEGWRFKNAEPSDLALIMKRVFGVFTIFIGLVFMLTY